MLETSKDMDPQSREILQTFVWWGGGGGTFLWIFAKCSTSKVKKKKKTLRVYLRATVASPKMLAGPFFYPKRQFLSLQYLPYFTKI